jgi:hypothetical protein
MTSSAPERLSVRTKRVISKHSSEWQAPRLCWLARPFNVPGPRARTGDHIAFRATPEILEATITKLQTMGREVIRARSNRALYFFDYDDHVFELNTEDIDKELGG